LRLWRFFRGGGAAQFAFAPAFALKTARQATSCGGFCSPVWAWIAVIRAD
jgi:hypothetical protein